jgi:pimeloyl-ACP methyl ester carboxylesterase
VNGFELHYEVSGEGPPLVWLHGLMGSIERERQFREGVHGLERRGVRLIAYDARGHGASGYTSNEADYTWQSHAADMLALLDHLGLERAHIGGGSMGAGVAICVAIDHPERVNKLVLLAPPPMADSIAVAQQIFGAFATLIESQGIERAVEVALMLPPFAGMKDSAPEEYKRTRRWLLTLDPTATPLAIRGLLNDSQLPDQRLGEIRAPALVVGHPDDPVHPQSSAERLRDAIAGAELVMAPDMNYYRDHGDELLDQVAAFLLE